MKDQDYNRYFVAFRLETPLTVGMGMDAQNHRVTLRHIPGSVLRGSLGSRLYRASGHTYSPLISGKRSPNPTLDPLFGPGGIRFGPLYPAWDEGDFGEKLRDRIRDAIIIPLTAWTCKASPGLDHTRGDSDSGHVTVDYAFQDQTRGDYVSRCKCMSRLERLRGYAVRFKENGRNDRWARIHPLVYGRTRVGLNRQSGTAETGILHSIEALQPVLPVNTQGETRPLVFVGYWSMTGEQHSTLIETLRPFEEAGGFRLSVGARKASGSGQGLLWIADQPEDTPELSGFRKKSGVRAFTITARSPIVCKDRAGLARIVLEPEVIREYYPAAPDFSLVENGVYVERGRASGWTGLWGLPKPTVNCISPGSVFAYTSEAPKEDLNHFLEDLTKKGLGEMLEDGYGQVDVNHSFHIQFSGKEEGNDYFA